MLWCSQLATSLALTCLLHPLLFINTAPIKNQGFPKIYWDRWEFAHEQFLYYRVSQRGSFWRTFEGVYSVSGGYKQVNNSNGSRDRNDYTKRRQKWFCCVITFFLSVNPLMCLFEHFHAVRTSMVLRVPRFSILMFLFVAFSLDTI